MARKRHTAEEIIGELRTAPSGSIYQKRYFWDLARPQLECPLSLDATRRRMVVRVDEDEVDLLAMHDEDVKDRIATHDRDIKEQLDRIEDKIDDFNEKLSLVLKTQIQQALVAPRQSRTTVLHTDRLEEVCDTAQEAIESSEGVGYRVKKIAQSLVDRARSLMAVDPKKAVSVCRNAYQSAAFPRKLQ